MLGFAELVKPESFSLLTMLTLYPGISFKKNSPFSFYNTNVQRTMYTVQCTWQMVPMEQSTACVSARGAGSSFRQVAVAVPLWHTAGDLLPLRQQWLQSVVFTVAHFTRLLILCFAVPVAYNSFSALRKCLSTMQRGERRHCNFEHI